MAADRSSAGAGRLRHAVRTVGHAIHRPPTALARRIRRATHAQGAGESGLGRLIELHAVNSVGDMLITIALASTIFFAVPTGEARGRVALYLAITMAPFALLAPVIGPLLDRVPHGRRAAMAATMLARGLLALALAGAVSTGGLELYPAALGVLVSAKAYTVVRSAVVPRLLPPRISLVKANSRVTLAGLLATGAAAPVGAGLHRISPAAPLYGAFAVFILGMFLSFALAHKVDSAKGERKARLAVGEPAAAGYGSFRPWNSRLSRGDTVGTGWRGWGSRERAGRGARTDSPSRRNSRNGRISRNYKGGRTTKVSSRVGNGLDQRPGLRTVGTSVIKALMANSSLRALSGLLLFFLAFMLREHPLPGMTAAFSLGAVAVAAGTGNAFGTALGAWLRDRGPEVIIAAALGAALTAAVSATVFYGTVTVAAMAATAGVCQALGKLSLDAVIQRDVPEEVRTSAFARSETLMQVSWVVGGAIGIALPLNGTIGMGLGATLVGAGAVATVRGLLSAARRGTPHPRVA